MARDAYGVIFADENTLVIDEGATEKQRAEIRSSRSGRQSLNDVFSRDEGKLIPSKSPVSAAGNKIFGMD